MIETIHQPVAVIALFQDGKIKPIRVQWNGRTYNVTNVGNVWRETVGATRYLHIAVETKQRTSMELVIDPKDFSWQLESVDVGG